MAWVNICDIIYPIGAYYISHDSTHPGELFGGTWTAVKKRFLYCNAGTSTGGSNTHTLTIDEIPAHAHYLHQHNNRGTLSAWIGAVQDLPCSKSMENIYNTGGGKAHNNMPAYQTVYAWRRTA